MMSFPRPDRATAPDEDDVSCRYPDCARPRRAADATPGRPALYCEQADPGGPIHNAANAWKERDRRRRDGGPGGGGEETARPVSMARLTLEDRLAQLPTQIDALVGVLQAIQHSVGVTGDREAVAAEVDQVHADALAQTAESDRLRRLAERQARAAEHDKDEADAAAQSHGEQAAQETDAAREQARTAQARCAELEAAREQARESVAAAIRADAERRAETASAETAALRAEPRTTAPPWRRCPVATTSLRKFFSLTKDPSGWGDSDEQLCTSLLMSG